MPVGREDTRGLPILIASKASDASVSAIAVDLASTDAALETVEDTVDALVTDVTTIADYLAAQLPSLAAFTPVTGAVISTLTTSAAVAVTGTAGFVYALTVRGQGAPEIDVNSDGLWATDRNVITGDTVRCRLTSSPDALTAFVATVYYEGGSQAFSVTTA